MSDTGDIFSHHRKQSQQKRGSNRERSTQLLKDKGIFFESKNAGAHLVVVHDDKTVDFWPGTGKWRIRGTKQYRRGVFNLLKAFGLSAFDKKI